MKSKTTHKKRNESQVQSEQDRNTSVSLKNSKQFLTQVKSKTQILCLQTSEEEVRTVSTRPEHQRRTLSISKKQLQYETQQKLSQEKVLSYIGPLCIPSIPVTFYDTINYESKKREIECLLKQGLSQQKLIPWVESNNMHNFELEGNCKLLGTINSDFIWKNVLPTMLYDVKEHSAQVGEGRLRFLSKQKNKKEKMCLNRMDCYLILCQMFFGLIPIQFHHQKANVTCSFFHLMHKSPVSSNNSLGLSDQQRSNVNKIKALLHYFGVMQSEQNQNTFQKQFVELQFEDFELKKQSFVNPTSFKEDQSNSKIDDHEDYYGTIGDQILVDIDLLLQKMPLTEQENKFNSGDGSEDRQVDDEIKCVNAFVEMDQFIDEEQILKSNTDLNLSKFFFEHPQAFVAKLIVNDFPDQKSWLTISGVKRYAKCQCENMNEFLTLSKTPCHELTSNNIRYLPRIVVHRRCQSCVKDITSQRLSSSSICAPVKSYSFSSIKQKIEKYTGSIKASTRWLKRVFVTLDFDQIRHQDVYLDFLLIWVAVSTAKKAKSSFILKFINSNKETANNIKKLHSYFKGKDVANVLSVILGYEEYITEKKRFFNGDTSKLPFLKFIKGHVF